MVAQTSHSTSGGSATDDRVHPFTRIADAAGRDDFYSDALNRERGDEPAPEWLIDGLLPRGVTVLVADPGAGKSMIVQQILHHLCYGRNLGDWDSPGLGGHLAWVIDLEGDAGMTRDRSYAITPYGELDGDGDADRTDLFLWYSSWVIPPAEREHWATYRSRAQRNIAYLATVLDDAAADGKPISLVVVDTLGKFLGPKGRHDNAYDWEAGYVGELNRLAVDRGAAIILIHHTNKAGEISGSTGIGGSATVACKLETVHDDETGHVTGTLRSFKVRSASPFAYPVEQNDDGTWTFTDLLHPSTAIAAGMPRKVLAALADGPKSRAELRPLNLGTSLGKVLDRLRRQGKIRLAFGRWQLVDDGRRTRPGLDVGTCGRCGDRMIRATAGQEYHPGCADTPPPAPAPEPDAELVDEYAEPADELVLFDGFRLMVACIGKSRMHPLLRVRESDRESGPWPLITERMTGEHRWTRPQLPLAGVVAVLDRGGSYPSAAGSVMVAANLLTHVGPLDDRGELAGIFLVDVPEWPHADRIGHPLGKLGAGDGPVWITTPHLDLLTKLAAAGTIPRPAILDSWAGRGTGGLFTAFSKAVREARERSAGTPEYEQVKRRSSIALRALWPKAARSPFWRPDWSVSVRAEASVRHWVRAWQAVGAGAELLAIGSVDEVAFVAPAGADATWVPEPYELGPGYGQVKHKPVKVGAELVASPLPLDVWANRHQGRRKP
jgi:hypothetical protein